MRRFNLMLLALSLVSGLVTVPAFAAPEENTWQKCNDGRDNDRDELVDFDDPDCEGVLPPAGALPSLVLTDNSGNVIGVPIWYDEGDFDAVAVAGPGRAAVAGIDSNNEIYGDPVYFNGAGCSGDAYIVDPNISVIYDFEGTCGSGCTGTVTGVLTLNGSYTPGTQLAMEDFVSFAYTHAGGTITYSEFPFPDASPGGPFHGVLPAVSGPSVEWVEIDGAGTSTGLNACGLANIPSPNLCPSDYFWAFQWDPAGIPTHSGPSHTWTLVSGQGGQGNDQLLKVHGVTDQFFIPDLSAPTADFTAASVLSSQGCDVDTSSFSGARPAVPFNLPYTPPVKAEVR